MPRVSRNARVKGMITRVQILCFLSGETQPYSRIVGNGAFMHFYGTKLKRGGLISPFTSVLTGKVRCCRFLSTLVCAMFLQLAPGLKAQSVYSFNAVGFINIQLSPGFNLLSCQLFQNSYSVEGTIGNLMPHGTMVIVVGDSGRFEVNRYSTGTGWSDPGMLIPLGRGFFVYNPTPTQQVLTLVGSIFSAGFSSSIPAGTSLCSSMLPIAGLLQSDLGFPIAFGDVVRLHNKGTGNYSTYFYGPSGWQPSEPLLGVAESFWVTKAASVDWVRHFSLQSMFEISQDGFHLTNPAVFGGAAAVAYPLQLATNAQTSVNTLGSGASLALTSGLAPALPTTYQWARNGLALNNGTQVRGADSATLQIAPVTPAFLGSYSVIASNSAAYGSHIVSNVRFQQSATTAATLLVTSDFSAGHSIFVEGERDRDYRLQVSTNLLGWTDLHRFVQEDEFYLFVDTITPRNQNRFYRVASP
jgi:hypothetical protein